jgi:outer membrane protein insertion porin family
MKRLAILTILLIAAVSLAAQEATPAQEPPPPADSAADWFWGKPIAGVQWEGIVHADKRELDSATKAYIGKDFTESLWMELQSKLYELDWFEKIEPSAVSADASKSKVTIKFTVTEKPAIESIRVIGNSGIKKSDILDAVAEKAGDIYNQSKSRVDELAIRRLYLERGYPDATVSSGSAKGKNKGTTVLSFTVNEGSQVAVREIRFSGNTAVSSQTLKSKMSLKENGFLQAGAFQESKLEDDKKSIVDYYKSRGYVDVSIEDVVRSYVKDAKTEKSWLILTVALKEGKQWLFGGMSYEGNTIFPTAKLAAYVNEKPGQQPHPCRRAGV